MSREAIGVLLSFIAAVVLIAGRVETCHMTEGEAFIGGWPYWAGGLGLLLVALKVCFKTDGD